MSSDKAVLIVGLGASGLASAQHLARQGRRVRAADTRQAPAGAAALRKLLPQADIHTGGLPVSLLEGVDLLVMSPGLSPDYGAAAPLVLQARQLGIEVIGEIELFARALSRLKIDRGYDPVLIGVTGTNGKTTTTTLTAKMAAQGGLRTIAAGNIGPNAVSELDKALDAGALPEVWVLELSSFQLATTSSLCCRAAALLNITEDHLDWHGGMDAYAKAKARIFKPTTVRVLNREDAGTLEAGKTEDLTQLRTFGSDEPKKAGEYGLLRAEDGTVWLAKATAGGIVRLIPEASLQIVGRHNAMNALAALALIEAAGLSTEAALCALAGYRGEPHRVEKVLEAGGVTFVDDSKGTNVGAVAAAVKGFAAQGRRVLIILGGDGKGQDFSPLAEALSGVAGAAALIGRDGPKIGEALVSSGVPLIACRTLEEAVEELWARRRQDDVLLLSPACASWDMFRDYAERSARFVAKAKAIAAEHSEG